MQGTTAFPAPTSTVRNILAFVVLASTAIFVRIPRLMRPNSYVIAAACLVTGGAAIGWVAPEAADPRSNLRRLVAAVAGAAITLPLIVTATQRTVLLAEPLALGLIVLAVSAHLGWSVVRLIRNKALANQCFQRRTEMILSEFASPLLAKFATAEIMVLRYVLAFRTPPSFPTGSKAFTCHRSGVLGLIWTVVALSFVEVALVHLVVRRWSETTAVLVSLMSEISIIYLVGVANSLRCVPTYVSEEGVKVRLGVLIDQHVSWREIEHIELINRASTKSSKVLRAAAISAPNVRLSLRKTKLVTHLFRRDQRVDAVEIYLDDADGFVTEAQQLARLGSV